MVATEYRDYADTIKRLAGREVDPNVTETVLAKGLNLNRLEFVKRMIQQGRLHD